MSSQTLCNYCASNSRRTAAGIKPTMPDPKEHRRSRAEMIAKSHKEGDIQTLARAIVNLYDYVEELERKLDTARRKIKDLEARIEELGG